MCVAVKKIILDSRFCCIFACEKDSFLLRFYCFICMVYKGLNVNALMADYDLDYDQLQAEFEAENLESVLDFVNEDSIFPVSRHRMWRSLLDNRYVVEDVVTRESEGTYHVRHILHPLLDMPEGTAVCSVMHRQLADDEPKTEISPILLLIYSSPALIGYCHYSGRELGFEAVASLVGSLVGPQMTYWIDEAGERACLQCSGGYLLGTVHRDGSMVMDFSAFMPDSRLAMPRALWPAEVAQFADLMGRVASAKSSMAGKVLRADKDEVLESILAFVRPMAELKTSRVRRGWEELWMWLMDIPQVWNYVAKPLGDKLFNPNSIAHILSQMNEMGVVELGVKSHISKLQPQVNENFRTNLSLPPSDRVRGVVRVYLEKAMKSRL